MTLLFIVILIRAAMNSKLCQIQNQSAESCQGTQFRTEWKDIFVIVPSSESLYWTDYCYFYISPGGQLSPRSIGHQENQH